MDAGLGLAVTEQPPAALSPRAGIAEPGFDTAHARCAPQAGQALDPAHTGLALAQGRDTAPSEERALASQFAGPDALGAAATRCVRAIPPGRNQTVKHSLANLNQLGARRGQRSDAGLRGRGIELGCAFHPVLEPPVVSTRACGAGGMTVLALRDRCILKRVPGFTSNRSLASGARLRLEELPYLVSFWRCSSPSVGRTSVGGRRHAAGILEIVAPVVRRAAPCDNGDKDEHNPPHDGIIP